MCIPYKEDNESTQIGSAKFAERPELKGCQIYTVINSIDNHGNVNYPVISSIDNTFVDNNIILNMNNEENIENATKGLQYSDFIKEMINTEEMEWNNSTYNIGSVFYKELNTTNKIKELYYINGYDWSGGNQYEINLGKLVNYYYTTLLNDFIKNRNGNLLYIPIIPNKNITCYTEYAMVIAIEKIIKETNESELNRGIIFVVDMEEAKYNEYKIKYANKEKCEPQSITEEDPSGIVEDPSGIVEDPSGIMEDPSEIVEDPSGVA
jgi:hypothetical protein